MLLSPSTPWTLAQLKCPVLPHPLLGWSLAWPICNLGLQYWIVKLCLLKITFMPD